MRRHRYGQRRVGGNGSLLLVGILILAVAVGYAGTKYFIAPYILEGKLWAPQQGQEHQQNGGASGASGSGIVSGRQDVKDASGAAVTATSAGVSGQSQTSGAIGTGASQTSGQTQGQDQTQTQTQGQISGQDQTQTQTQGQTSGQGQTQTQTPGQPSGQTQGQTSGQNQSQTPAQASASAPAKSGYAVQFGSFSTKTAADQAVTELAAQNITASVLQKDGAYKVVGSAFDTKAQAAAEAERLRTVTEDAFVTVI